eukprot:COSAG05_NODE_1121_length_5808_cov_2.774391_6_plen_81_part_00
MHICAICLLCIISQDDEYVESSQPRLTQDEDSGAMQPQQAAEAEESEEEQSEEEDAQMLGAPRLDVWQAELVLMIPSVHD